MSMSEFNPGEEPRSRRRRELRGGGGGSSLTRREFLKRAGLVTLASIGFASAARLGLDWLLPTEEPIATTLKERIQKP